MAYVPLDKLKPVNAEASGKTANSCIIKCADRAESKAAMQGPVPRLSVNHATTKVYLKNKCV